MSGSLTFVRIYSAERSDKGINLINTTKDKKERISRLLEMHANQRKDRDEFFTGDIAACIGLKYTSTGDTLCAEDSPLLLEKMDFPEPVISMAIEPKSKADREKLSIALCAFLKKIQLSASSQTKKRARRSSPEWASSTWRSSATVCSANSASKPTSVNPKLLTKRRSLSPGKNETKYVKQSGGRGQYAHVVIEIEPNEKGKGNEVVSKIVGGVIPKEFIPPTIKGIKKAWQQAFSQVTASSTSKSQSSTVLTTKSTQARWRLRSADRWLSKKQRASASRSS